MSFPAAAGVLLLGVTGIAFAPIFALMAGWWDVGPSASAFWRMGLAVPLLLGPMIWSRSTKKPEPVEEAAASEPTERTWLLRLCDVLIAGVPGVFLGLDMVAWHTSFLYTPVANATLLANLATLVVSFVGWAFLQERLNWRFPLGVAAALVGIAVLLGVTVDERSTPFGNGMACIAAACYAGYLLGVKIVRRWYSAKWVIFCSSLCGSVVLFPIPLLLGDQMIPSTPIGWLPLLGLAAIPHVAGQGLIIVAMRHLPASIASVMLLAQPVMVAVLGMLILDQSIGLMQGLGGLIVIVGLALAIRGRVV
ncbi:DMT family transporter [Calycomorphotria hydatis]|uniref:EamA-like transporter family protein n=1 Tax=Calycomorphotria hydatis TaxID=2528027 RepID=A0A517T3N1_9PLAN|nr:DMT family transporter [Calycomorphotria hydatis]QDT62951.1 EamA-like transporter family protein [Calycomorphotria hydatis]